MTTKQEVLLELNKAAVVAFNNLMGTEYELNTESEDVIDKTLASWKANKKEGKAEDPLLAAYITGLKTLREKIIADPEKKNLVANSGANVLVTDGERVLLIKRKNRSGAPDGVGNPGGLTDRAPGMVGKQTMTDWLSDQSETTRNILTAFADENNLEWREEFNKKLDAAVQGVKTSGKTLRDELLDQEGAEFVKVIGLLEAQQEFLFKELYDNHGVQKHELFSEFGFELLKGGRDDIIKNIDRSTSITTDAEIFTANNVRREVAEEIGAHLSKDEQILQLEMDEVKDYAWILNGIKIRVAGTAFIGDVDFLVDPRVGILEKTPTDFDSFVTNSKSFTDNPENKEVFGLFETSVIEALALSTIEKKYGGYAYPHEAFAPIMLSLSLGEILKNENLEVGKEVQIKIEEIWNKLKKSYPELEGQPTPVFSIRSIAEAANITLEKLSDNLAATINQKNPEYLEEFKISEEDLSTGIRSNLSNFDEQAIGQARINKSCTDLIAAVDAVKNGGWVLKNSLKPNSALQNAYETFQGAFDINFEFSGTTPVNKTKELQDLLEPFVGKNLAESTANAVKDAALDVQKGKPMHGRSYC